MSKWKSIKIKPKDDKDVLVYFDKGFMNVCNWCKEEKEWQQDGHNIIGVRSGGSEPIHWMPLPNPPILEKEFLEK